MVGIHQILDVIFQFLIDVLALVVIILVTLCQLVIIGLLGIQVFLIRFYPLIRPGLKLFPGCIPVVQFCLSDTL